MERFEFACLVVEVAEIIVHEADEPNVLAHLFDADALTGEDDAEPSKARGFRPKRGFACQSGPWSA